METFLEFIREILKGIMREIAAFFFQKNVNIMRLHNINASGGCHGF